MTAPDYTTITELPETPTLPLQLARSYHRYVFGAYFCDGKEVLEIACGGGQGLGLLAKKARRVVGGDYEERNLAYARQTYANHPTIEIAHFDAHCLPFPDRSFDVVLCYEAIYYFADAAQVVQECRRVLRPGGCFILCTANKHWADFNPSPYSHTYLSVSELHHLLSHAGLHTEFFGAFPDRSTGAAARLRSLLKRTAVRLRLMPKTMRGKQLLKRLFFGRLVTMPRQLMEGEATYKPPQPIPTNRMDTVHTAIYAVARLEETSGHEGGGVVTVTGSC